MIKRKHADSEIEQVCKTLLRQEEAAGRRRSDIARDCHVRQNQLNKWLDEGQGMSSESIDKVLSTYGKGMTPETIARLIRLSERKERLVRYLLDIAENQPDDVVDKIEAELHFWTSRKKPDQE